ncbi:MAG: imidazoleglycerol-phosphate dehydratase HisB [Deltaproteobacteria bacterium]|nr:imidazoleglycerol-phosphate dehydratase HisB [Deltaproteobacteria bacterium]
MARMASVHRKTTETEISIEINLDGTGEGRIATTIPFLDHMLNLFAKHGFMDLTVRSSGDTDVDDHHLVEDLGICLGQVVGEALGDRKGICRYGAATVPMDESLCSVAVDISGRPNLIYHVQIKNRRIGNFDPALLREFFKSFSDHSRMTLHINLEYGRNGHHMVEAVFKSFARAIREAVDIDDRLKGVLSTKGSL